MFETFRVPIAYTLIMPPCYHTHMVYTLSPNGSIIGSAAFFVDWWFELGFALACV
jgi:hypothetical protein